MKNAWKAKSLSEEHRITLSLFHFKKAPMINDCARLQFHVVALKETERRMNVTNVNVMSRYLKRGREEERQQQPVEDLSEFLTTIQVTKYDL